ncbi:MAG: hypothetical protein HYS61_03205 [Acidobacteria bacterium]|nr:hypothetical protein [Acidobacteriota bacterium]
MPEQISKYPEVTIQVLKAGGARYGAGIEKQILKKCPSDRFCALPGGEVCVYGIDQIPQMTQISVAELARVVCQPSRRSGADPGGVPWPEASTLGLTFVLGLAVGAVSLRLRKR